MWKILWLHCKVYEMVVCCTKLLYHLVKTLEIYELRALAFDNFTVTTPAVLTVQKTKGQIFSTMQEWNTAIVQHYNTATLHSAMMKLCIHEIGFERKV